MSAQIIDGIKCANQIYDKLKSKCTPQLKGFLSDGVTVDPPKHKPTLAILTSDRDPASRIYVRNKMNKCVEVGIACLTASVPEHNGKQARNILTSWANDDTVDGIIIQRPSAFENLQHLIPPSKDVDGAMIDAEFDPCTPRGVMHLLHSTNVDLEGKHAVVIGRSDTVGKPMAEMLLEADCTVTTCHSRTENLADYTRTADILVCAAGHANLVTADMVKPGAIVVDVGINRIPDPENPDKTKIVGDVDYPLVKEVAGWITPVPGGVGPMTVAILLDNVWRAHAEKHTDKILYT